MGKSFFVKTYVFVIIAVVDSDVVQKPFVRIRENCTQMNRREIQHPVNPISLLKNFYSFFYSGIERERMISR